MPAAEFLELLRSLTRGGIDFILVGGLAAVLQGAPVHTYDVDIVHNREPANLERLLVVLAELDAVYRISPERQLRPGLSHLASPGHQNLMTRFGPLDLLGAVGRDRGYPELLPQSETIAVEDGLCAQVLGLAALIRLKEELGSDKDRAMLPILRQTLRERGLA